jgi:predicted AlkP superfamily pyrophosphatase or phosphodiesterase
MKQTERVILIVIDGLRPDGMQQARTPNLDRLMARGVYSLQAQTVMPSITLPCHLSMFYGVPPMVHGVIGNFFILNPDLEPGLIELAHQAGLDVAAFYSWEQLRDLWRQGTMKHTYFLNIYSSNTRDFDFEIARAAADYLVHEPPNFTFVYLGMVDEIAHKVSWMSDRYMDAIQSADAAVGHLLDRLEAAGLLEGTTILLQSDHGGHGQSHGTNQPEDMTIPWMISGPGVRRGGQLDIPVSLLDTAPTLAHLLGLPVPASWDGRVVTEALEP